MKLKKEHSENCFMKDKGNPWSGIIGDPYWGDKSGGSRGRWLMWYTVKCNDPKCPGLTAISMKQIREIANKNTNSW
jgi:hypothetical protein